MRALKIRMMLGALGSLAIHAVLAVVVRDAPFVGAFLRASTYALVACVVGLMILEDSRHLLDELRAWLVSFTITAQVAIGTWARLRESVWRGDGVLEQKCACGSNKKLKSCCATLLEGRNTRARVEKTGESDASVGRTGQCQEMAGSLGRLRKDINSRRLEAKSKGRKIKKRVVAARWE
jgi:hypothetical protein